MRSRARSANEDFLSFTSSVHFDHRLWKFDIAGSIAHATVLSEAGILSKAELSRIVAGLRRIARNMQTDSASLDPRLEDIHMNVEKLLTDEIGELGGRLHTGRSRNDQVALDTRLLLREMIERIITKALSLQNVLLARAAENQNTILPGYTHMQRAQPVLLSHHLLAHFWRLQRDVSRLTDCYRRTNSSPLGSGALAGTGFDLDRGKAAELLGMDSVTENSLDAVSDRDFVAEATFGFALLMIHVSSMCEEIVNWSSKEFGFVRLPPAVSGGSSMMPQKVNPDIAELARGKSGRTIGDLIAILTLLKSLPLAYNRDLQEDKESLFDAFDTAEVSLQALTRLLSEVDFDTVRMRRAAEAGLMTATDLADLLTLSGIPFRRAHSMVKELAIRAHGDDVQFLSLAKELLREHRIPEVDSACLGPEGSVARRVAAGGTSMRSVSVQMSKAKRATKLTHASLKGMKNQTARINKLLQS